MKFLHAADLHLDSPLRGLARYDGAPVEAIRGATRRALENLVALALEEQVDFVLVAGDVYDGDWKDYNSGLFFARQMSRLGAAGVPVFLISGNHDAASQISRQLKLPGNVTLFHGRKPATARLDSLGVAIHGHGYAQKEVTENLAKEYPEAIAGMVNIGLLHTSLDGRAGHAGYAPCTLDDLRAKGYDYWALGHVHTRETLSEAPWVVYPGNPQGRHIHEDGPRGCVIVEIDGHAWQAPVFHALDVVRWHQVRIDATRLTRPEDVVESFRGRLRQAVEEAGERLLAVRLHITGATAAHAALWRDPERWENELRAAANDTSTEQVWVEKVKLETRPPVRLEQLREQENALGSLLRSLDALRGDAEALAGLAPELDELKAKLPVEARSQFGVDPGDPQWLAAALGDVEQILLARLAGAEGEA